jgi:NAD(P)H-dependent FMN reductase
LECRGFIIEYGSVALFIGSVRRDRQGIKVARWMEEKLIARGHSVYFIDPLELNLPLFDRMYKEMENPSSKLRDLQNKLKCRRIFGGNPEYNHSTSAATKNTLRLFLGRILFQTFSYCFLFSRKALAEFMLLNICD